MIRVLQYCGRGSIKIISWICVALVIGLVWRFKYLLDVVKAEN